MALLARMYPGRPQIRLYRARLASSDTVLKSRQQFFRLRVGKFFVVVDYSRPQLQMPQSTTTTAVPTTATVKAEQYHSHDITFIHVQRSSKSHVQDSADWWSSSNIFPRQFLSVRHGGHLCTATNAGPRNSQTSTVEPLLDL